HTTHRDIHSFPTRRSSDLLEIDDTLAEAHSALGWVKWEYDWDWPGAEKEYQRAIELKPSSAIAHFRYAEYLITMGRVEEGLSQRSEEHTSESSHVAISYAV